MTNTARNIEWIALYTLIFILLRPRVRSLMWRVRFWWWNRHDAKRWAKGHLSPDEMNALMKWIKSDEDV